MSDEVLRKLEREVASGGPPSTRIRLASELERRGRPDDATSALFEALKANPSNEEVRLALGKFRGPPLKEWGHPQGNARNTRRAPVKGPRGQGRIIAREELAPFASAHFTRTQDQRTMEPNPVPAPLLVGRYVYSSLATGRRVLAVTADGHLIAENFGASGFEWSANRDGKIAWRIPMPVQSEQEGDTRWWSEPHAAIEPDATTHGVTSLRHLIAIEPTGDLRFDHILPAQANGLALDVERGRLYVLYLNPCGLSTRDIRTGEEIAWASLASLAVAHNVIVCDDGRVACISPFREVGIVSPSGELERTFRFSEKIGGAEAGLSPTGELVVVSWDPRGASVEIFDPTSGAKRGFFNAVDCRGAPAIDSEGTLYLDGGARCVVGYDLINHKEHYAADRPSFWREPNQAPSHLALREGEVAFVEVGKDGVALVRVGA